jgi:hypothetical protein
MYQYIKNNETFFLLFHVVKVINPFCCCFTGQYCRCAMVSMLASSVVEHGCERRSGHTKDYQIGFLLLLRSIKEKEQLLIGSESG